MRKRFLYGLFFYFFSSGVQLYRALPQIFCGFTRKIAERAYITFVFDCKCSSKQLEVFILAVVSRTRKIKRALELCSTVGLFIYNCCSTKYSKWLCGEISIQNILNNEWLRFERRRVVFAGDQ